MVTLVFEFAGKLGVLPDSELRRSLHLLVIMTQHLHFYVSHVFEHFLANFVGLNSHFRGHDVQFGIVPPSAIIQLVLQFILFLNLLMLEPEPPRNVIVL